MAIKALRSYLGQCNKSILGKSPRRKAKTAVSKRLRLLVQMPTTLAWLTSCRWLVQCLIEDYTFIASFKNRPSCNGAWINQRGVWLILHIVISLSYPIVLVQEWTWEKRLERFFKTYFLAKDPLGLSAIDPNTYQDRFMQVRFITIMVRMLVLNDL